MLPPPSPLSDSGAAQVDFRVQERFAVPESPLWEARRKLLF